jgi:hypothetical protein
MVRPPLAAHIGSRGSDAKLKNRAKSLHLKLLRSISFWVGGLEGNFGRTGFRAFWRKAASRSPRRPPLTLVNAARGELASFFNYGARKTQA